MGLYHRDLSWFTTITSITAVNEVQLWVTIVQSNHLCLLHYQLTHWGVAELSRVQGGWEGHHCRGAWLNKEENKMRWLILRARTALQCKISQAQLHMHIKKKHSLSHHILHSCFGIGIESALANCRFGSVVTVMLQCRLSLQIHQGGDYWYSPHHMTVEVPFKKGTVPSL